MTESEELWKRFGPPPPRSSVIRLCWWVFVVLVAALYVFAIGVATGRQSAHQDCVEAMSEDRLLP